MKTELSSLAPASFETEMLVVFAINKADKKDKQADPQIELLTPDGAVTSAAAKAVSGREFAAGSCETLLLHQPAGLKAARLLDRRSFPAEASDRAAQGGRHCSAFRQAARHPVARTLASGRNRFSCHQHGSRRGRRRHHRRLRFGHLPLRPQGPQHGHGHAAGSRRRSGTRIQVRAERGRHHRGVAELCPRAHQRARQRADPDRVRPPRRSHGEGKRPRSARSTPPTSSKN